MARSACLQNPHWVWAFPLTGASRSQPAPERTEAQQRGVEAFIEIAKVLPHSRCLNCHTTTNFPRQGDDRHALANLVRRGETTAESPVCASAPVIRPSQERRTRESRLVPPSPLGEAGGPLGRAALSGA